MSLTGEAVLCTAVLNLRLWEKPLRATQRIFLGPRMLGFCFGKPILFPWALSRPLTNERRHGRSTMSKSRRPDGAVYSPPEISIMWAELPKHERDVWYERAKEAKLQHEAANPGYKYHPRKKPYNSRRPTESLAAVSSNSSSRLPRPPLAPHSHSASQV